ncbi:MAG: hypothetical protein ACREJC_18330, partial [Tepidisphaeraceae bacterium]
MPLRIQSLLQPALAALLLAGGGGCVGEGGWASNAPKSDVRMTVVSLSDQATPATPNNAVVLSAARNEWTSFTIQIDKLPAPHPRRAFMLRVTPLNGRTASGGIGRENFSAFQVLSMPVDVNRAGYVRHTGLSVENRNLPRALLNMPVNAGLLNLSAARDPARPTDPQGNAGSSDQPLLLWFDLHIPPDARGGDYTATLDLLETGNKKAIASVSLRLTVYDFVIPDQRHLQMVGRIDWSELSRLHPDRFEAVSGHLINRGDPRYSDAVRTLDQLVTLAQDNRAQVVIPGLQPAVKWPAGRPPQVDWTNFDSIVSPWLVGDVFRDRTPVSFWPLPAVNMLHNYDRRSQRDYWSDAANHFDQLDWLARSAVVLDAPPGRADTLTSVKLSSEAAEILSLNPRMRVMVPLEDDQIQFASPGNENLIRKDSSSRLITSNPGLVFSTPLRTWPSDTPRPARWLRTDLPGLTPHLGAGGGESDVRLWAWFASVPLPPPPFGVEYGPVQMIQWSRVLPQTRTASEPADPNDLTWFYPGSWFGVDTPVPTVQLKWLRRAQQDFEYVYLARERGEKLAALLMARVMTKPVELEPGQKPDPTYSLMSGSADPQAWSGALSLLAQFIMLREPGGEVDREREKILGLEMFRWAEPQERPVVMGHTSKWLVELQRGMVEPQVAVQLGIDIYNAADSTPDANQLEWTALPDGWHVRPQPISIPQLATYHVKREVMDAEIRPSEVRNTDRRPVEISFTNGFNRKKWQYKMMLPLAASERREGQLNIDGSLEDWTADDAIQDGPLVLMFNCPDLQEQELNLASTPTRIYTGWADENFYVAFRVSGLGGNDQRSSRNFVTYQYRRAWGEDLCQMLIQPVYSGNVLGPVLNIVCKPNGQCWIERKLDPKLYSDPWQPLEATFVRYVATVDGANWRGEVAIPWRAIIGDMKQGRPPMLQFNFSQHKNTTGESASWAGPVDFGRDD